LKAGGIDMDFVAKRVSALLNIPEGDIWREGKAKELVRARSLLCFWAVRELGVSMTAMARRLNISHPHTPLKKRVRQISKNMVLILMMLRNFGMMPTCSKFRQKQSMNPNL